MVHTKNLSLICPMLDMCNVPDTKTAVRTLLYRQARRMPDSADTGHAAGGHFHDERRAAYNRGLNL